MDSAIPPALRCPRTRTRRIEDDYAPPYPAWVARADPAVNRVVMGYFGVQSLGEPRRAASERAIAQILATFGMADGPAHHDLAHYVDPQTYDTSIAIGYWTSPARYDRWRSSVGVAGWWNAPERLDEGVGYFREILYPEAERFETLFSASDQLEGIGAAMGGRSAEDIQEHGYWGSMRERFALAQTDGMAPSGHLTITSGRAGFGQRLRLTGHENIAVIRSGQDWSATTGRERELYLNEMEPIFRLGMDFLRDHGGEVGCYSNRYMQHVDVTGRAVEKTFGYSYWRSLSAMERWSEAHPTHVAIFGTFMRIVQELKFQVQLRLYHEVSVLKPDQQEYEYLNCHPQTGLLNGLSVVP
jgi:aldoxime dehydratase